MSVLLALYPSFPVILVGLGKHNFDQQVDFIPPPGFLEVFQLYKARVRLTRLMP
jgi:hypothetical protein